MIQCVKVQYATVYILFTAGGPPHTKGALLGRHTLSAEYSFYYRTVLSRGELTCTHLQKSNHSANLFSAASRCLCQLEVHLPCVCFALQAKLNMAQDAKRQAACRAGTARSDWQERCRERVREVRASAAEKARTFADAAVQVELDNLQVELDNRNALRKKANARARGAEAREAASSELAGKRLKAMHEAKSDRDAAVAANDELHDQLEGSTHQDGVDALAKLAQIPKLGTVAVHREGRGGAHGWDFGMRGTVVELLLNGTPTHAIPGNILTLASYLLPFVKEPHVPHIPLLPRHAERAASGHRDVRCLLDWQGSQLAATLHGRHWPTTDTSPQRDYRDRRP